MNEVFWVLDEDMNELHPYPWADEGVALDFARENDKAEQIEARRIVRTKEEWES